MGENSNKYGVLQLKEQLFEKGLRNIVFSPGSRNAPLIISFAGDDRFNTFVIPDERSAGFYALGMAEQLGKPVAAVCTSGSALLNYYPAVCEAFYRNIPLVIISADRPDEWEDHGDGQTIRQKGVFKNHICDETNLIENPRDDSEKWFNRREIERIVEVAVEQGPVHINFPFKEPLYQTGDHAPVEKRNTRVLKAKDDFSEESLAELTRIWNSSKRKLIICGQMPKDPVLQDRLERLTKDKSVAILVENTSNLYHRDFIHCIDRTINSITEDYPELFRPDLLITLGGAVISKKIKAYLRKFKPDHHWRIGKHFPFMDTYQSLTLTIPVKDSFFINCLLDNSFVKNNSRYSEQWKNLDYRVQDKHQSFLASAPYSDLSVFRFIMDIIPDNSRLHLANSSVVRYAQLFEPVSSVIYTCNRGTSGIDGSTSTAMGAAVADPNHLHTFISGDISFFYDSNAFWNHHLPENFRMFVINNGGGGIFKIIPGPDKTEVNDRFFVAKQSFSANKICEAFDINYFKAESVEDIEDQLHAFFGAQSNKKPALMEIFTPTDINDSVLKDYFNKIKISDIAPMKS